MLTLLRGLWGTMMKPVWAPFTGVLMVVLAFAPAFAQSVPPSLAAATTPAPASPVPAPPVPAPPVPAPPVPAPPVDESKLGSVFVRCDGLPDKQSAGVVAAQALLIVATGGASLLVDRPELADVNKRLKGADGVAACQAALAKAHDGVRKTQLGLALSVHDLEAKAYDAALADARAAPGLAGDQANDLGFRHSLALSALELQAFALVELDRPAEAADTALRMAAAAPYDIIIQQRAYRYVALTSEMSDAKRAYFDNYVRLDPSALAMRHVARGWSGDFKGGASDLEALCAVIEGFVVDKAQSPQPNLIAAAAVDAGLAGDQVHSDALAAQARAQLDDLVKSGRALSMVPVTTEGEEMLDLQAVISALSRGRLAQARAAFAGRSRWISPTPAVVAELDARLRAGAAAGDLFGPLARDPSIVRAEGLAARAGAIKADPNGVAALYAAIWAPLKADAYTGWSGPIWGARPDAYIVKKTGKEVFNGDTLFISPPNGLPTGEALLLRAALIAKARSAPGFIFLPHRVRLDVDVVRFGAPGDPGFPSEATLDPASVIAGVSKDIPPPQ